MSPHTILSYLLYLLLSLSAHISFSYPISANVLQKPPNSRALQPLTDIPIRRDHPQELTPVFPRATGGGRPPITRYRNLGAWRMALTATSVFYSAAKDLASTTLQNSATARIVNFLASTAEQASEAIASGTAESESVEFGVGALELAFRVRDGEGSGTGTIPWELVRQLAQYFEMRARYGNALGFRAVVTGPLGVNVLGGSPWIEVVLVVAGQEVLDGVPWSVY